MTGPPRKPLTVIRDLRQVELEAVARLHGRSLVRALQSLGGHFLLLLFHPNGVDWHWCKDIPSRPEWARRVAKQLRAMASMLEDQAGARERRPGGGLHIKGS